MSFLRGWGPAASSPAGARVRAPARDKGARAGRGRARDLPEPRVRAARPRQGKAAGRTMPPAGQAALPVRRPGKDDLEALQRSRPVRQATPRRKQWWCGRPKGGRTFRSADRPGRATQNDPQGGETQPQGPSGSETATVQQTPASEGDPGEVGTRSASGRAGIIGAVLAVDDDALTLESPRGELAVTLSEATTIYEVSESGREALAVESRVQVGGSRSPEGGLAAQWVVIVPEGMENLFGLAGNPGVRQRGQAP